MKVSGTDEMKFRVKYPGAKRQFTNSIGMKFVFIPSGTFMMGSPLSEPERESDERQHRVTLTRGFYMGVTEVTQKQWRRGLTVCVSQREPS